MTKPHRPFNRLLIANRGEIALRIVREAKAAGLVAIAVYSDADDSAAHVVEADVARRIGPPAPALSYLDQAAILAAARDTGAEAIHPGYGFLAENADFAEAVIDAGLVWIGPSPVAIRAMGDKGAAKRIAREAGVPLIPGYDGADQNDATLTREAETIGWPVMIKAAMGGGGRGMRRVAATADFAAALASARREAKNAFGDDRVILEKAIDGARHVEVQVFGDAHGAVVHLGERDCSVQRRNQKIIEEAPAPGMSAALREEMGAAAVALARAVGYVNAGTVEFLLSPDGAFFFLEMNTRIQVEHPVTEEVTGLNLIRLQFDTAMGKPLPFAQSDLAIAGHAIEARLCAEDAGDGFKPQTGEMVLEAGRLGPAVRIDAGGGGHISGDYDSMIAKVIAKGATREEARAKLDAALEHLTALGVKTNRAYLRGILNDRVFIDARMDTTWLGRREAPPVQANAALAHLAATLLARGDGGGWSSTGARRLPVLLKSDETQRIDVTEADLAALRVTPNGALFDLTPTNGAAARARLIPGGVHVMQAGDDALFQDVTFAPPDMAGGAASGEVKSPMAGKIAAISVAPGAVIAKGAVVAILESMKMEHEIRAAVSGTVEAVAVTVGAQVPPNALLAVIKPDAA